MSNLPSLWRALFLLCGREKETMKCNERFFIRSHTLKIRVRVTILLPRQSLTIINIHISLINYLNLRRVFSSLWINPLPLLKNKKMMKKEEVASRIKILWSGSGAGACLQILIHHSNSHSNTVKGHRHAKWHDTGTTTLDPNANMQLSSVSGWH